VLLAEAGMDEGSRFAVMVGVRIDDPSLITDRLTDGGDGGVVEVLRDVAFATRISFASKRQLGSEGRDWPFVLVANVVRYHWSPDRPRCPVIAHAREGGPFDVEWSDAFFTNQSYGPVRVRTEIHHRDDRLLLIAETVARIVQAALEDDPDRPSAARERYDVLAPFVSLEDVGANVTHGRGVTADELVRMTVRT